MNIATISTAVNSFLKSLIGYMRRRDGVSEVEPELEKERHKISIERLLIAIYLRMKGLSDAAKVGAAAISAATLISGAGLISSLMNDTIEQQEAKKRLFICLPLVNRAFPESCDANLWAERAVEAATRHDADQAIRLVTHAIAITSSNAEFYNDRGAWESDLQKDWPAAHRDFSEALRYHPNMPFALYNDGTVFARQNKYNEAKERYDAAIKATSPGIFLGPYRDRGIASYILGDNRGAVADLNIAIANGIKDERAFYIRGKANGKIGNTEASLADLENAAKIGKAPDTMLDLSYAYLRRGSYQQALDILTLAIKDYPSDSGLHNNRGVALLKLNEPGLARDEFQNATDLDKHNSIAWANLGDTYAGDMKFDKAVDCYKAALADDRENANIFQRMSAAQVQAGRGDEALQSATRSINIDPENVVGQLLIANSHSILGLKSKSIAELDGLIEKNPNSFAALASRCGTHIAMRQYDEAMKDCNAALRIDTISSVVLAMRCMISFKKSVYTQDCNDAIEVDKNGSYAYAMRAMMRMTANNTDGALKDAKQAVLNNANDAFAQIILAVTQLGSENYRSAIDAADASIKLNPSLAFSYALRAAARFQNKDIEDARKDLDKMRTLASNNSSLYTLAGYAEIKAGEYSDASEDLEVVIGNGDADIDDYLNCAAANYNAGKHDRAFHYVNEVMKRSPRSSAAYTLRGVMFELTSNHPAAVADLTVARNLRTSENISMSK